jgi:hypothetical protein
MKQKNVESGCGHCGGELEGSPSSQCKVNGDTVHSHCFVEAWQSATQGSSS